MFSEYYQGHLKLDFIADLGQQKLQQAKVLVIGAGGLGCPCLNALASSGIGIIGVVDADQINISNIQRQTLFNFSDIGAEKANVSVKALKQRNPSILYQEHCLFVNEKNILKLIDPYDIIVDATDNFQSKYLINDACIQKNKPLIYGALFQTEGQVAVFNYKGSPTLRCLFDEPGLLDEIPSCADTGVYLMCANIIGNMMANEVIKTLLNNPDILFGKLLSFNALDYTLMITRYQSNRKSREISQSRFNQIGNDIELSAQEFLAKIETSTVQLIDVRTPLERTKKHIGGKNIPFAELISLDLTQFYDGEHFYFYCQTGTRSLLAAKQFRSKGYNNAFSLRNGIINLNQSNL